VFGVWPRLCEVKIAGMPNKRKKNVWRLAFCPDRAVQPQNDNLENEFDGFFLQIF
jgi:hypothetical protein